MVTNTQFTQRPRQHQEHRRIRLVTQSTNRELAQQARRRREHLFEQQRSTNTQTAMRISRNRERSLTQYQVPIACTWPSPQYLSTLSFRHQLARCNISCQFCGAQHWIEERVQNSTKEAPKFSTCCENGAVMMDKFEDPPEPLYSLLMDSTPCIFPCMIFANDERLHNSATTYEIITMPLH